MRFAAPRFEDELSPAPEETWWDTYQANRELYMAPQQRSWTCSICSTDWLLRATGLNPYSTREGIAQEFGPCVDEFSGLKDTNCMVRVLESYGVQALIEWVDWRRAMEIASTTAFIVNSGGMYHFMGGRGVLGNGLWVANSAAGYKNVYDSVSRAQFDALTPWKFVYLVR